MSNGNGGVRLEPPVADELPDQGFDPGESGFLAPAGDGASVDVVVKSDSERLELLDPFPAWDGNDLIGLRVLMKAAGKCTTDHISPAGKWLRYRGHLTNISQNLFTGVNNAFALDEPRQGIDVRDGSTAALPDLANANKEAGIGWVA
jgi:aconitate hydratase